MDINRKQFLGSLLAGATIGCTPAFAEPVLEPTEFEPTEFEKCRNDILYFVDNYLVVDDRLYGKLKMTPQQREYLKRISTTPDYFFCAKGRQIGISTANAVFAYWKTTFFENQYVFIVEPNRGMCRRMEEKYSTVSNTGAFMPLPNKVVFVTPSTMMANNLFDKNSTFILDEFAFYDNSSIDSLSLSHLNEFLARLIDSVEYKKGVSLSPSKFIVVSTPSGGDDTFSLFMHYVNNGRKLVLPSPTRGLKA